jgi:NAD(P)-dependent dehydrogenase (short-subunit alcohol dehydrogenase family)
MGLYAVTGGTKGIGQKTAQILRARGHEVISIDIDGGDINADLGTVAGREHVISEIRRRCPGGLDGLVCNHGIGAMPRFKLSYILSVNYFGAVAVMEGLYELLKMKKGNCVVTVSGAIVYARRGKYYVDQLLNNCGDEERIGRLVDKFTLRGNETEVQLPLVMYQSSKIALARRVRRVSASWAAHGVTINAVAPGGVATTLMQGFVPPDAETFYYPMPALFGQNKLLDPTDVAEALTFLVTQEAKGINGVVLFCDAGASAVYDSERYM